jgi:hypothetical protein
MDGMEYLKKNGRLFSSVSVTSSELILTFSTLPPPPVVVRDSNLDRDRSASEYVNNNENLILTPDRMILITDCYHALIYFTPVAFKNNLKGFRIMEVFEGRSFGKELTVTEVAYVALSDTPVQVGEEDLADESRELSEHEYYLFNPERVELKSLENQLQTARRMKARALENSYQLSEWELTEESNILRAIETLKEKIREKEEKEGKLPPQNNEETETPNDAPKQSYMVIIALGALLALCLCAAFLSLRKKK